jgi:general secretion pathway protein H
VRGFTLVELLMVMVLIALASGLISLSVRDPAAARLDQEAMRLAALLEGARAEARATGVAVRFELAGADTTGAPFRFVGLPPESALPDHWLDDETRAEIIGARALRLGPEPLIGPQRIVLRLGDRSLALATDGLAPFSPVEPPAGGTGATP